MEVEEKEQMTVASQPLCYYGLFWAVQALVQW